jgi:predicted metal-dependent enzyme (double-stranded beta helix superfamily)
MSVTVAELPKVTGTCPELVSAAVRRAVGAGGTWHETAARVAATLRGRLPGPGILSPQQLAGDQDGYQTHLVHAEPDGSFSIVVMVWLPGQTTPVHDHLTWCVTAVLQGTEYEEVYAHRGDHLEAVARNANPVGTVSGFAPPGDIHKVTNIGDAIAVSMHVYGTDISRVGSSVRRVYDLPVR